MILKKLLNQKEQWYADTPEEAEEIVSEAKEEDALVMHKISEKHNKYGAYRLVDLQFSYHTPKEIMEEKASKPRIEKSDHEGVEYEINSDGTVSVPDGQLSIDELNEESEDEE